MGEIKQFRLPDVGEGLVEAEILSWKVRPGDTVKVNEMLVEIETAKAAVELPSPFAGVVADILVPEGETVDVGTPIIGIDVGGDGGPAKREPVLVGYGVKDSSAAGRRPRKGVNGIATQATTTTPAPPPEPPAARTPAAPAVPQPAPQTSEAAARVLAKPPVRKLAKDLGVDLATVTPTGPNGTVSRDDVQRAVTAAKPAEEASEVVTEPTVGAFLGTGERRVPIRGVRKSTAAAMVSSAFTAPHVTEFLTVDVTRSMKLLDRLKRLPDFADVKISPLLLVAKALLVAIKRNPDVNARWDEPAGEIVLFEHVNLGIAAATPRGLVVPNVKAADRLALPDLARALNELTRVAREGKATPADLSNGTITITNVGVFGVDTGTPILNPGEAAILAFGAIREQPWVHKGKVKPRQVTTLGLSFDHRLVDGELGSKVLRDIGAVLTDPLNSLVWG
jgi:pyruvate dehydrogenase E2 component (dihydrolipoamide acetyltransferase)